MAVTYRVCLADTDAAGIVYHARYLEMAERSRNEVLRHARMPPATLLREGRRAPASGMALVVHRIEAKYHRPAFADDLLTLHDEIARASAAKIRWITRIERDDILLCSVEADLVSIDVSTGRPCFIAQTILDAVELIGRTGAVRPAIRERADEHS